MFEAMRIMRFGLTHYIQRAYVCMRAIEVDLRYRFRYTLSFIIREIRSEVSVDALSAVVPCSGLLEESSPEDMSEIQFYA